MRVSALIELLRSRALELAYEPSYGRIRVCALRALNFSDPPRFVFVSSGR